MNYRVTNNEGNTTCIYVPNIDFLKMELCLCFLRNGDGLPFNSPDDSLREDMYNGKANKILSSIIRIEQVTIQEHVKFNRSIGISDCFPVIIDSSLDIPNDWYERCVSTFVNPSWRNELSWHEDLEKFVNGECIDSMQSVSNCVVPYMHFATPNVYLEGWKRYLYHEYLNAKYRPVSSSE